MIGEEGRGRGGDDRLGERTSGESGEMNPTEVPLSKAPPNRPGGAGKKPVQTCRPLQLRLVRAKLLQMQEDRCEGHFLQHEAHSSTQLRLTP